MKINLYSVAGDGFSAVVLRQTKAGDKYLQEESIRRAAKRLGCSIESLRLEPFTSKKIGVDRLDVITKSTNHIPLFGVISETFFEIFK